MAPTSKLRRPEVLPPRLLSYQRYSVAATADEDSRKQAVQAVIRMLGVEALDAVAVRDRLPATGAGCVRQDIQLETVNLLFTTAAGLLRRVGATANCSELITADASPRDISSGPYEDRSWQPWQV